MGGYLGPSALTPTGGGRPLAPRARVPRYLPPVPVQAQDGDRPHRRRRAMEGGLIWRHRHGGEHHGSLEVPRGRRDLPPPRARPLRRGVDGGGLRGGSVLLVGPVPGQDRHTRRYSLSAAGVVRAPGRGVEHVRGPTGHLPGLHLGPACRCAGPARAPHRDRVPHSRVGAQRHGVLPGGRLRDPGSSPRPSRGQPDRRPPRLPGRYLVGPSALSDGPPGLA